MHPNPNPNPNPNAHQSCQHHSMRRKEVARLQQGQEPCHRVVAADPQAGQLRRHLRRPEGPPRLWPARRRCCAPALGQAEEAALKPPAGPAWHWPPRAAGQPSCTATHASVGGSCGRHGNLAHSAALMLSMWRPQAPDITLRQTVQARWGTWDCGRCWNRGIDRSAGVVLE